jgi:hypothetical protein
MKNYIADETPRQPYRTADFGHSKVATSAKTEFATQHDIFRLEKELAALKARVEALESVWK